MTLAAAAVGAVVGGRRGHGCHVGGHGWRPWWPSSGVVVGGCHCCHCRVGGCGGCGGCGCCGWWPPWPSSHWWPW